MDLGYRPLTYMWIAEFSDGSCLPQFDPDTGKQNKGDPDWMPSRGKQLKLPEDDPLNPAKLVEAIKGVDLIKAERPKIFLDKKMVKFGWYPFSAEMAARMSVVAVPTRNPYHVVDLKKGDELVACRRNHIEFGLRGSGYRRVASLYLLGIRGGKIKEIGEDGSLRQNA